MNMNHKKHEKVKPIEFNGFRMAKGVEIDPFENERQNEPADFNYSESATMTRMVQP